VLSILSLGIIIEVVSISAANAQVKVDLTVLSIPYTNRGG